jgi:hypothetical protein
MDHEAHPGMSVRPPASAFLCIDSEDRYANGQNNPLLAAENRVLFGASNPGNSFSIQKRQPLLYGIFKRVGLVQTQLFYRAPTIVANKNDEFVIDISGGGTFNVNLDEGYYDASGLAAHIQAQVLALTGPPIPGFVCQYDPQYGGLVMSQGAGTVQFAFNTGGPQGDDINRTNITLGVQQGNLNYATTHFLGTPQLLYTRFVDIVSSRLAKFQRVKDADTLATNKSNIVTRIYLTAPNTRSDPSVVCGPLDICVDPNTPKHSMWSVDEAIYELDFQLYDEYGELLYWAPEYNTEFQITLLASET